MVQDRMDATKCGPEEAIEVLFADLGSVQEETCSKQKPSPPDHPSYIKILA
jgi:hypothetical protein